jgi:hypothetical protein
MPVMVPNLRDIGGVAADGRTVRTGQVLRSALPAVDDLVPEAIAWPPALVLDLRSAMELDQVHPLQFRAPQVVNLPLLSSLQPGASWPATLADLYLAMVRDARHLLVDLVGHIATEEGPTLIHCAAGKDRTGVAIALLLRLLGVEREAVIADYLLSRHAAAAIASRIGDSLAPSHFFDVPVEAIESVLDWWDTHDGGTEGWYLAAGGSCEDLSQLRKRLLE